MKPRKYIIKDWAGNRILPGYSFISFEDAWDEVFVLLSDLSDAELDKSLQEYYVERVS